VTGAAVSRRPAAGAVEQSVELGRHRGVEFAVLDRLVEALAQLLDPLDPVPRSAAQLDQVLAQLLRGLAVDVTLGDRQGEYRGELGGHLPQADRLRSGGGRRGDRGGVRRR
jgi:hypothetical protein